MHPATHSSHPSLAEEGETMAAGTDPEPNLNDITKCERRLELRIHVGDLRSVLKRIENELSGLKRQLDTKAINEQRCAKRSPRPQLKPELIKGRDVAPIIVSDLDADEKDILPEKDVGFVSQKSPHSKLPVLEKSKTEDMPKVTVDILTKVVGLETLYGVLMEEHLGQQLCLQETSRRLRAEERRCKELEEKRNPINVALAERIGQLEGEVEGLQRTVAELREENDHLEFRLLEMDEAPIKKTVVRSSDTRYDLTDIDDVSDSGVMSLPPSDDEHQDFTMEAKSEGDVKSRLLSLSQNCGVAERICLQQGLALLRHYEARIESLESTIAAMCSEATFSKNLQAEEMRGSGRIIATVLPFTERKDCLQESGIFEEAEWSSRGTQTEPRAQHGDLTTELEKLSRIREKIETATLQPELPPVKQLAYYKERVETLESRLALYEAQPDEMTRLLRTRLEKEARLEAEIRHLRDKLAKLEEENRVLEEERCELEEAENDTRLRCQKLELKLSAVGEKKNCLKAQLEQLSREMAAREEESKQAGHMEALVKNYEKKNQELEEREMEVRYRLQMLENTMPALLMWNMWRMMVAMQTQHAAVSGAPVPPPPPHTAVPFAAPPISSAPSMNPKEEELIVKLQNLEARLNAENRMLMESRNMEEVLRNKVHDLEVMLDNKDSNIMHMLDRNPDQDIEAFEKMTKLAKERIEMKRRIKDLEMKEVMYQETLQEFDGMFANLEGNYSKQLKAKDDALFDKEAQLADKDNKIMKSKKIAEENSQLQERMHQLEEELERLTEALKKREAERDALEKEERKINQELQECLAELDNLKKQVEGPILGQLDVQKKKSQQLQDDLEKIKNEKMELEADRKAEVSTLKNRINQLTRDIMESDVTIGELREEVQTLELAIDELRYMVTVEKAGKEELRKEYEAKLEEKDRLLEELANSMKEKNEAKSLRDELDELMLASGESISVSDFPKSEEIETEIALAKKIHRSKSTEEVFSTPIASDSEDTTFSSKLPEIGESDIGSINSKMKNLYDMNQEKNSMKFKTKTAKEIQELIVAIDRGDTLIDVAATKDIFADLPLLVTPLNRDCQIAQEAVTNSTGRDIKGTVDNLTKAFQHSKTCKKCNETLGSFLGDLIKELGVRLPSVTTLGNHQM